MKVDRVVRDLDKSHRRVLEALDHNLTARDNFGPEGEEGWVLTSRGPDHIPEYRPVTLSPDTSIDWSAISGTPTTIAGYGIENAYTITQINTLLADQTHPAEDIVSGILDPSRLGSGASGTGSYLRGDSTWQPLSLSGLGLTSEVGSLAGAHTLVDQPQDDWPTMIPGPRGTDGVIGRDGAVGPPGMDGEPLVEWPLMIPGVPGPQGTPGAPGAGGGGSSITQLLLEEAAEQWNYPNGPSAQTTPAGPTFIQQLYFEDPVESWNYSNGPSAAAAAAGGGSLDGAGVALRYASWVDANTLQASPLIDANPDVQLVHDTANVYFHFQPGNVAPGQSATNPGWQVGAEDGSGDFFIRSRWTGNMVMEIAQDEDDIYFGGDGVVYATIQRGAIILEPQDAVNEGGQVTMLGAGAYADWVMDNFQGRVRWFTGAATSMDLNQTRLALIGPFLELNTSPDTTSGLFLRAAANNFQIRTNDDGVGNQQDATKPSWAFAFGEGVTDNFVIYRKPPGGAYVSLWGVNNLGTWFPTVDAVRDIGGTGNRVRTVYAQQLADGATGSMIASAGAVAQFAAGSSWTQLNLYTGAVARWHIVAAGHYAPVADNTYDIGINGSNRVRDIRIAGEVVGMNGGNGKTADQATFANALTDITGTSWLVGVNEQWEFEIFIPYLTNATAGTVGWTVNGPAGTTVAYTVFGTTTALTAYSSVYSVVINVGVGALGALISQTHFVVIRGRLSTVGTAGTAIARGITSAAGKTVAARNGAYVKARRVV